MPMPACDVCSKPAVGVACSTMGAITLAYCLECSRLGREPYFTLLTLPADPGAWASWVMQVVEPTLAFYEKTLEQLLADIRKSDAEAGNG